MWKCDNAGIHNLWPGAGCASSGTRPETKKREKIKESDAADKIRKQLREYLSEFHPKIIGLTGTYDEIKSVCKAYRVYFSTPPVVKPGQDYLVDHSIYFYLMG